MKVIVGLGNPGSRYTGTRHNIGFETVDYLASAPGVSGFRNRFESQIADAGLGAQPLLLVKPETFMNLSGRAVRAIVDFYKVTITDVLVICDDIALPLGKLRLKAKGSHGGQNGLRNIEQMLGTADYARLRMGVGDKGVMDAADFVLSRFKPGERTAVDQAIAEAAKAALVWCERGIDAAMNATNGGAGEDKPARKTSPATTNQQRKTEESRDDEKPTKDQPRAQTPGRSEGKATDAD